MSVFLAILTVILVFVSLFLILVVLAQKSKDGGMGAALGGGAAEAAFGAETSNVLSRSTIYAAILFFVLAFITYLGRVYQSKHIGGGDGAALPAIAAPALPPVPAGSTPAAPAPGVTVPLTTAPAAGATAPATTAPATATPTPAPDAAKKP
ncbi:MAG TPA: preprotein translocase subunit SecG [Opitutaceae bacterium]|nr:preprotein translocase subunit SecG [Opitutaceae bacterium]